MIASSRGSPSRNRSVVSFVRGVSRSITRLSHNFITAYANTGLLVDAASKTVSVSTGSFDVHVLDPVAYAVSLLIIIAACLVAASIPATRAARLNPTRALRQE